MVQSGGVDSFMCCPWVGKLGKVLSGGRLRGNKEFPIIVMFRGWGCRS